MRELIRYLFRASPRGLVLAILASLVSGLGTFGLVVTINGILARRSSFESLALQFVLLCGVVVLTRHVAQVLLSHLGADAAARMQLELSRLILSIPLRRLEEVGPARLLTVLTEDVAALAAFPPTVPMFCANLILVLACLGYLGWLSPALLLAFVLTLVATIASYRFLEGRARRFFMRARQDRDALHVHFRALTDGLKELKLHRARREAFLEGVLKPASQSLRDNTAAADIIQGGANNWARTAYFVLVGTLGLIAYRMDGSLAGTTVGFAVTILYLAAPLEFFVTHVYMLRRMSVALDSISRLGVSLSSAGHENAPAERTLPEPGQTLELRGVTHAYETEDGRRFMLGPIDLSIRKGRLLFIVGGNGSGKTTLVKVLMGLYPPATGEILLDGRAITDQERDSYRQLFSAVFSDFHLFDSLLGLQGPELDERAGEYLAQLRLEHKVRIQDGVLSTTALSQGQRKRLALLTAYLENRPFYVFDEWAADQDPLFKELFYRQLLPALREQGKGVIVISHDDRYFPIADTLVKLEDGRLLEPRPMASAS